jgi:hypothetical protein
MIVLGAALAAAGMLGCAGVGELDPAVAPVFVKLRLGEEVQLASWDRVRFERVSGDSRCPVGTKCVWAGAAQVEMSVTTRANTRSTGELSVSADSTHSTPADVGRYRLLGMQLDPYPKANHTIDPASYRLTLRIDMASSR